MTLSQNNNVHKKTDRYTGLPPVFTETDPIVTEYTDKVYKLSIGENTRRCNMAKLMEKIYARYLPEYVCPHEYAFSIILNQKDQQIAEMLGDKLMNTAITITLSQPPYNITNEGTLTEVFNRLSNTNAVSEMARILKFDELIGGNPSCSRLEDAVEVFMYCIFASHRNTMAPLSFINMFYEIHNPTVDPSKPYVTLYSSYEKEKGLKEMRYSWISAGNKYTYRYDFEDRTIIYETKSDGNEKAFKADACKRYLNSRDDFMKFKVKNVINKINKPSNKLINAISGLIVMNYYIDYDTTRKRYLVVNVKDSGRMSEIRNTCHCLDFSGDELIEYYKNSNTNFTTELSNLIDPKRGLVNDLLLLYDKLRTITEEVEDPLSIFEHGINYGTKHIVIGQSSTRCLFIYFRKARVAFYGDSYGKPELLEGVDCEVHCNSKYNDVKQILKDAVNAFA